MLIRSFMFCGFIFLSACVERNKEKTIFKASEPTPSKPNVLLIMADDMGFSDIGCFGGEIKTPYLDELAATGKKFSQFYNTGRCCPSRASLLTGKYPHAVDMGWMNSKDFGRPGYRGDLSHEVPTIATTFSKNGYNTYMVGKWHLMAGDSLRANIGTNWPTDRGFDEFYGTMEGAKDYFRPSFLYRNRTEITTEDPYFYTHAITDSAVAFIKNNKKAPFLLYTAFYAPHFPLHAPQETVNRYVGNYLEGWQHLREERLKKQQRLRFETVGTKLSAYNESIPRWEKLTDGKQKEMDLRMAIYAAQVEELDKGVGKLIEGLKESGQYDNTLIVFISDNGAEGSFELGRGEADNLNKSGAPYTSYGRAWASASNTPYRKFKSYVHEGGIIAPMIVSWPKEIKPAKNFEKQPIHIIDLVPTLTSLAKVENYSGKDGKDMSAWFLEESTPIVDRKLFWEHEGKRAVRIENWKLVSSGIKEPWELYDLQIDPVEDVNLINQFSSKASFLEQEWNKWAENNNVLPIEE